MMGQSPAAQALTGRRLSSTFRLKEMVMTGRVVLVAAAMLLASCSRPSAAGNAEEVAANTLGNIVEVEDDADDRAQHLDEAAQERAAEGRRIGGDAGQALENEAAEDVAEAAAARSSGERQAKRIEDDEPQIGVAENKR